MRIVVDTNILFSAILNTNSKISQIILHPKSKINFYSTNQLLSELTEHKTKLKKISNYTEFELQKTTSLIINKIKFISVELVPKQIYQKALKLTTEVNIDDTEFVALTEHIKGKLWTGDNELSKGLKKNKWEKLINVDELYKIVITKK